MTFDPTTLLGAMFESVEDDEAFAALPAKIAKFAQTQSAQIQIHTRSSARTEAAIGIQENLISQYNKYYWQKDIWAIGYKNNNFKSVVASESYVPFNELINSEIYNDLLRINGDLTHCIGFVADIGEGEHLVFGAHRERRQPEFQAQLVRSMEVVHPYLSYLMRARRRAALGRGRLAQYLMDMERDPILVVTYDGQVHFANAAAQRLSEHGFPIRIIAGRLSIAEPTISAALTRMIRWACTGKGGGTLSLDRRTTAAFDIAVDTLGGRDRRFARVRIRDREGEMQRRIMAAREKYSLTPAEAALAEALLQGMTLSAYAESRSVTMPTVRTQLQSLFGKAGVSRQVDLVALLRDLLG